MSFEEKVKDVVELLANNVYGYSPDVLQNNVVLSPEEDNLLSNGIPHIERRGSSTSLILPNCGSNLWAETIGGACEIINIDPDKIYIASFVALLELANVVNYSVNNQDVIPRLRKIHKVFSDDRPTIRIGGHYSDTTSIDFSTIVRDLDPDDIMTVQKLRYGVGVAIKAFVSDPRDRQLFAEENAHRASNEIENYVHGVSAFLDRMIIVEDLPAAKDMTAESITADIAFKEFPFIAIAASHPMKVELLLNRSK